MKYSILTFFLMMGIVVVSSCGNDNTAELREQQEERINTLVKLELDDLRRDLDAACNEQISDSIDSRVAAITAKLNRNNKGNSKPKPPTTTQPTRPSAPTTPPPAVNTGSVEDQRGGGTTNQQPTYGGGDVRDQRRGATSNSGSRTPSNSNSYNSSGTPHVPSGSAGSVRNQRRPN